MNTKVMFFLSPLGGGGAERNAARVGTALRTFGYSVSFAVYRAGFLGIDGQVEFLGFRDNVLAITRELRGRPA